MVAGEGAGGDAIPAGPYVFPVAGKAPPPTSFRNQGPQGPGQAAEVALPLSQSQPPLPMIQTCCWKLRRRLPL